MLTICMDRHPLHVSEAKHLLMYIIIVAVKPPHTDVNSDVVCLHLLGSNGHI